MRGVDNGITRFEPGRPVSAVLSRRTNFDSSALCWSRRLRPYKQRYKHVDHRHWYIHRIKRLGQLGLNRRYRLRAFDHLVRRQSSDNDFRREQHAQLVRERRHHHFNFARQLQFAVGERFHFCAPNGHDNLHAHRYQHRGSATSTATVTVQAAGSQGNPSITTSTCPGGTQGAPYSGCTITASGGAPPYTFSVSTNPNNPPLPEGMSINATTGAITSSLIGGQGAYVPEIVVADSNGAQATQQITFAIAGDNAFLANIFPGNSIFHHRVDAASTSLPVDASPAAAMYSGYLSETIKPFFGNDSNAPFPNGIPAIEVPYNQPDVSVTTTVYQSYFTSGPIPPYAPVEGTSNSNGDARSRLSRSRRRK